MDKTKNVRVFEMAEYQHKAYTSDSVGRTLIFCGVEEVHTKNFLSTIMQL